MSATGIDFAAGLRSYLVARGHELRGHEIKISCPSHEDENPSCRVNFEQGVYRCDPCGAGGGALDLVAALEACDRPTAMRILSGDRAVSAPTPAPARTTPPPTHTPDLRGILADYRASLRAAGAKPALDWLAKSWNVSRAVLDGYGVGLGPTVRVQTDRGTVETFSLVVPSSRDGSLSGLKIYRPRWRELAGDRPGKVISQKGSKPALVGGHLLGDAEGRTVLVVGGEKDTLVAAAALSDVVVVAHAGGEGAWAAPKRATTEDRAKALAAEILAAGPARIVLALDVNEADRGLPEAVGAFARAGAVVHVVAWPGDFCAQHPKGGVAQFILDPSFGPAAFRALVEVAESCSAPPVRIESAFMNANTPTRTALSKESRKKGRGRTEPTANEKKKKSVATRLVELGIETGELFHDSDGATYAMVQVDTHLETLAVRSKAFRAWLAGTFYRETEDAAGGSAIEDALQVIEARARFDSAERPVFRRVAEVDGSLYLDLGDPEWRVAKVTPKGWSVEAGGLVAFARPRGLLALPEPVRGGRVAEIFDVVNVPDEDERSLVIGWLLSSLRPRGPYLGLGLIAPQGTGKSFATKQLRNLIDPRTVPLRSPPKNEDDLMVTAAANHVLGLENLSHLQDWLSDALCRVLTGGGLGKREHFENDAEFTIKATRPVIVNGISDFITRADLADRFVIARLGELRADTRESEEDLDAKFTQIAPRVLGGLLDATVKALADRRSAEVRAVVRQHDVRMVDAALWVTAAEAALDVVRGTFARLYAGARGESLASAAHEDPVAEGIASLLAS